VGSNRAENRFEVLTRLHEEILNEDNCPYFVIKRKRLNKDPPRKLGAKQKRRDIKVSILQRDSSFKTRTYKSKLKVPDTGPKVPWKRSIELSNENHKVKMRKQLLTLSKQARGDFEKSKLLNVYLTGVAIYTRDVSILALPYVSTHPEGYVFIYRTPDFRAARTLLSQCLHCPSTFLEKVSRLSEEFVSIDRVRAIAQQSLTYVVPLGTGHHMLPSSNEGKSFAAFKQV